MSDHLSTQKEWKKKLTSTITTHRYDLYHMKYWRHSFFTTKRTQKLKVNNDGREKIVNYSFNRELIRHLHISDKIFIFDSKHIWKILCNNIRTTKVILHSIVLVYISSIVVFYVYRHQLRVLMEYILLLS